MRHHNKIILAERRKQFQWHKMKRAGKNTFATFLLPPPPPSLSLSFFPSSLVSLFFADPLGGAQAPQAPPPLGCAAAEHVLLEENHLRLVWTGPHVHVHVCIRVF